MWLVMYLLQRHSFPTWAISTLRYEYIFSSQNALLICVHEPQSNNINIISQFRQNIVNDWNAKCIALEIPCTLTFSLAQTLGNVMQIRDWTLCGLPPDQYSIENAIIVKNVNRFPLMIDPQGT